MTTQGIVCRSATIGVARVSDGEVSAVNVVKLARDEKKDDVQTDG
jgi:hypothetical protein